MTLADALAEGTRTLEEADAASPRLNAEVLLMHVLSCDRAYLFTHPERELSSEESGPYQVLVRERASGKPTQYITGHQEFWGLDFEVSSAVLIPRPETEHSVEAVLEIVRRETGIRRIADVGTGSGCIALALAHDLPARDGYEMHACDISPDALAVARRNTERLGLTERVQFHHSDLLADVPGIFDLIVSNPPYVGEAEPEKVQRIVRDWEPKVAVFGGQYGMDIYARLIPQAKSKLRVGGWLVMEIGYSIEGPIRSLLSGWEWIEIRPDLQGIPRVAVARKPS